MPGRTKQIGCFYLIKASLMLCAAVTDAVIVCRGDHLQAKLCLSASRDTWTNTESLVQTAHPAQHEGMALALHHHTITPADLEFWGASDASLS